MSNSSCTIPTYKNQKSHFFRNGHFAVIVCPASFVSQTEVNLGVAKNYKYQRNTVYHENTVQIGFVEDWFHFHRKADAGTEINFIFRWSPFIVP